ncbi:hypothetical protein [Microbulbifer spongiae]|uniref:Uncharacterized protein n=1 Tax=Microbulbifer spongiae TaxID=2944933 RepID=A0ABY9ED30_9GAMM|nr:hypothetical protein [Microbulbifer sp. MI-G]WKD50933.1 hypothetical protein M8T91_05770 [Microbulbifer sp. MI-G]
MLDDLHIHDFYRHTGRILLALFDQFPVPATLYVEDIAGPDTPDAFGLHSPHHLACLGAMTWLKQSGYIDFAQLLGQEAMENAVLSHRGFLLLINTQAEPGQSNAQLLNSAVRSGSSAELQALMEHLMREFAASRGSLCDH